MKVTVKVYRRLPPLGLYRKAGKIIFLGLDNAGKTTLLSVLKAGHMVQPVPTLHPSKSDT